MLYSREELQNLSPNEDVAAIKRYFHKIYRKETKRLFPHECEHLAIRLRSIYSDQAGTVRLMEPYDQPFLADAIFKYLIVIYLENLDFLKPVFNGVRELTQDEINLDQAKFNECLQNWRVRLNAPKIGNFIHEVRLEYLQKLKILENQRKNGLYGYYLFLRKCLEQELNSFYTYFIVKTFFTERKSNFLEFAVNRLQFVINIYSYVHIVSRHYIPKLNSINSGKSFNDELPFIDPFNLPLGLRQLILDYFRYAPQEFGPPGEYMIFSSYNSYYILWWKRKKIDDLGGATAYEVRTLYKIQSQTDRLKINFDQIARKDNTLAFYY